MYFTSKQNSHHTLKLEVTPTSKLTCFFSNITDAQNCLFLDMIDHFLF